MVEKRTAQWLDHPNSGELELNYCLGIFRGQTKYELTVLLLHGRTTSTPREGGNRH